MSDFYTPDFNNLFNASTNKVMASLNPVLDHNYGIIPQFDVERSITGIGSLQPLNQPIPLTNTSDSLILPDAATTLSGENTRQALTSLIVPDTDPLTGQGIVGSLSPNQPQSKYLGSENFTDPIRPNHFAHDYRFTGVSPGQQVQVDLSSNDFDAYLELVNGNTGQLIAQNDDFNGSNSRLGFTVQPGINYLVRVTTYSPSAKGSYDLRATSLSFPSPTPSSSLSSNNNIQQVGNLNSRGYNISYYVGSDQPQSWYQFQLSSRSNVALNLTGLNADADLELRDINQNVLQPSTNPGNRNESIYQILEPGTYYARVFGFQGATTSYNLGLDAVKLSGDIEDKRLTVDWRNNTNVDLPDGFYPNGVKLHYVSNGQRDRQGIDPNKDTIVIIHGWNPPNPNNSPPNDFEHDTKILGLATTAAHLPENPQVLVLDWKDPANQPEKTFFGNLQFPYITASAIRSVAQWAVQTLDRLGLSPDKISIFGHSLGSYVGAEIGKIFAQEDYHRQRVKNLVALDPASSGPFTQYDIDGNQVGLQGVASFQDAATRSLALVVADTDITGGVAGDNDKAATANKSLVVEYDYGGFGVLRDAADAHGAVINVFGNALANNKLKLSDNFALPNDLRENKYQNNGAMLGFGGQHEGKVVARIDGTIERLEYVDGDFNHVNYRGWT